MREFIDDINAHPGTINFAAGIGQSSHLTPVAFAARTGLDLVAARIKARLPLSWTGRGYRAGLLCNVLDVMELVQGGKGRWLAISTAQRLPLFPDVPTAETVPDFVMTGWIGYFAPAGTQPSIINQLSKALAATCREPDIVKTMARVGVDTVGTTPEQVCLSSEPISRPCARRSRPPAS